MIVTPTSLTLSQLLGSQSEQYVIPSYQRRYSWHEKQLMELLDDIKLIEGPDTHLLGSIVCLVGHHQAGINRLELVDGQQRITTINILLHCILERLAKLGETSEAIAIEGLLQSKALGSQPIRKIALDSIDAHQFERHVAGEFLEKPANPNLALAFKTYREWVNSLELSDLGSFMYRLKNQAVIIRLDVSSAKDAFKLFETINNRGLKLSPTDIIKNFILGNAARFGSTSLELARARWAEVLNALDATDSEAFFRHFLAATLKKRITRAYVVSTFKGLFMQQVVEAGQLPERHLYADDIDAEDDEGDLEQDDLALIPEELEPDSSKMSFAEFMTKLTNYAKVYGEIVAAQTNVAQLDYRLKNLRMIKSTQTYGFLMALRAGGCPNDVFAKVLRLTEAFMLRRHICRQRSNENETLFARLCSVNPQNPIPEVTRAFRDLSPTDDTFETDFAKFQFSGGLIDRARYCLQQIELHHQGKHSELLVGGSDLVQVEHIIPQKIRTRKAKEENGDWPAYLGDKAHALHPHFVSRIGNLSLFAGQLNAGASNNPYERKKESYQQSSIKITNQLPQDYPDFRFSEVETRSTAFASVAPKIWPIAN